MNLEGKIIVNQDSRPQLLSIYHGDFEQIGVKLADKTNGFENFSIITNLPYGKQSEQKQGLG